MTETPPTPPAPPEPPVWWSPSHGVIQASATGFGYSVLAGCKAINGLPPDAIAWPAGAVPDTPTAPADLPPVPWEARDSRVLDANGVELFLVHGVEHWNHDRVAGWLVDIVNQAARRAVPDTGHRPVGETVDLGEAIALVRARVDSLSYLDFGVSDDLDAVRMILAAAAGVPIPDQPPAAREAVAADYSARCAADMSDACVCRSDEPCMLSTCPDSACHAVEREAIAAAHAGVDRAAAVSSGDTEPPLPAVRDVLEAWREFASGRTGWMQGDAFPPELEDALDRLTAATRDAGVSGHTPDVTALLRRVDSIELSDREHRNPPARTSWVKTSEVRALLGVSSSTPTDEE